MTGRRARTVLRQRALRQARLIQQFEAARNALWDERYERAKKQVAQIKAKREANWLTRFFTPKGAAHV